MPAPEENVEIRTSVLPRALIWVLATLPLQDLMLIGGSRRDAGETGPLAFTLILGLAWIGCALGSSKTDAQRKDWIPLDKALLWQGSLLALLVILATHPLRTSSIFELLFGVVLLVAFHGVSSVLGSSLPRVEQQTPKDRSIRLFMVGLFAAGLYGFGSSIKPSEHPLLDALVLSVVIIALPTLTVWLIAWILARLSRIQWEQGLVRASRFRFSTRPGHVVVAFFISGSWPESSLGWIAFPLLLLLFGLGNRSPLDLQASPRALGRWMFPLALPLVGAATLHMFDSPLVASNQVASHAVVGIFFGALAPVLPALALAIAGGFDRARNTRWIPGLGMIGFVLLLAFAFGTPHFQVELGRAFGRELVDASGTPSWHGFPIVEAYRAQVFACLALALWMSARAWRWFRDEVEPRHLPLAIAAAATILTAANRVPVSGASGAAQALMVGALAGFLLELPRQRSTAIE